MSFGRITSVTLTSLALTLPASLQAASSKDEAAILRIEAQQAIAWNARDSVAYGQLFSKDADVVNVLGWWWKSRAELEQKLGMAFKSVFAHSTLEIEDVSLRFLTADLAVAHVRWSMTGAVSPDGSGGNVPQQGIQTQVLRKQSGRWLIVTFQNTNAVPERPFAKPPGAMH